MSEVEKLVERLNAWAAWFGDQGKIPETDDEAMLPKHALVANFREAASTLQSQARRVEELEGALRPFAGLRLPSNRGGEWKSSAFTIAFKHIEIARSALSEGSGSSRELAPPDESGDACGATERAEG